MPPRGRPLRIVRRIGNQERALIHDHYMRNGPVWDLVINDMIRDNRFQNVPANVQDLYQNVIQRPQARRRIREFIQENKGSEYHTFIFYMSYSVHALHGQLC